MSKIHGWHDTMARKPWATAEWRKKRAGFLVGKSCEWCGSTEAPLTINHKKNFYANFERGKMAYQLMIEYFQEDAHKTEAKEIMKKVLAKTLLTYCHVYPTCKGPVNVRKKKKPKFRCCSCNLDFDKPLFRVNKNCIRPLNKAFFHEFSAIHKEEIDTKFAPIQQKADQEYLDFKDVMVLCKKHNLLYTKDYRLCPVCKRGVAKLGYPQCYQCYLKTERGKKLR